MCKSNTPFLSLKGEEGGIKYLPLAAPSRNIYESFTEACHNGPYQAIAPKQPELCAKSIFVVVTGGATGLGKVAAISLLRLAPTSLNSLQGER